MTRVCNDADRRAVAKYQAEKTKQIGIRFFPADMELYDFVKSHDNVNGYIKELIRKDMRSGWE